MVRADMDERERLILNAIVDHYIHSGEPVGSRTLTKLLGLGLSAATIRNVMADLTDQGYLEQPHTSAGRVPSNQGYRFYADGARERAVLPPEVKQLIDGSLSEAALDLDSLLVTTTRLLAELTSFTGLVAVPRLHRARLKLIEFIKVNARQVFAVVVTRSDLVHSRLIEVAEDLPQEFLVSIGRYLTQQFRDRTLYDIRREVLSSLVQEREQYDQMLAQAARLSKKAFDLGDDSTLYVEGQRNLVRDFHDIVKVERLMKALEEKIVILATLERALTGSGMLQIYIGLENSSDDLQDCALVTAKYGDEESVLGALGVIGPTRMDYARVIPIIHYMARSLSQAITD
ncbi:MAG: heat-inducible transcription repressor HrcA [Candidatus Lambdaproteobacteria bacterium]|nr:heat-inducible transcription repressor HrcA [Candidatus Lambdaproteobacteria bacterium]